MHKYLLGLFIILFSGVAYKITPKSSVLITYDVTNERHIRKLYKRSLSEDTVKQKKLGKLIIEEINTLDRKKRIRFNYIQQKAKLLHGVAEEICNKIIFEIELDTSNNKLILLNEQEIVDNMPKVIDEIHFERNQNGEINISTLGPELFTKDINALLDDASFILKNFLPKYLQNIQTKYSYEINRNSIYKSYFGYYKFFGQGQIINKGEKVIIREEFKLDPDRIICLHGLPGILTNKIYPCRCIKQMHGKSYKTQFSGQIDMIKESKKNVVTEYSETFNFESDEEEALMVGYEKLTITRIK